MTEARVVLTNNSFSKPRCHSKWDLIYIFALFLMLFPDLKFFDNTNLCVVVAALYIMININVFFNVWGNTELTFWAFVCLVFLLSLARFVGVGIPIGFYRELNGYLGFTFVYFATKIYFHNKSIDKIDRFFKKIYKMFFRYSLIIGGLQAVYIYIGNTQLLKSIFEAFLYRGGNYFFDYGFQGKINFAYGEPSFVGTYLFLLGVPAFAYCYIKKTLSKRYLNITIAIIIVLNLLSKSTRFAFDSFMFVLILLIITGNVTKIKKRHVPLALAIAVCVPILIYLAVYQSDIGGRIVQAFNSLRYTINNGDSSTIVRLERLRVGVVGFIHNPLIGVGIGNYGQVLHDYAALPINANAASELLGSINNYNSGTTSYSFYATSISESGLLGVIIIIIIIRMCLRRKEKMLRYCGLIIILFSIQTELYGFSLAAMWLAIFNSNVTQAFQFEKTSIQKGFR